MILQSREEIWCSLGVWEKDSSRVNVASLVGWGGNSTNFLYLRKKYKFSVVAKL
jgi:hypothetical protein